MNSYNNTSFKPYLYSRHYGPDKENQLGRNIDIKKFRCDEEKTDALFKETVQNKRKREELAQSSSNKKPKNLHVKSEAPSPPLAAMTKSINIQCAKKILFSQATISDALSSGIKLSQLKQTIIDEGWSEEAPPLRIVEMPNGRPISLDNRRLYVLKEIASENARDEKIKNYRINIIKYPYQMRADRGTYNSIFSRFDELEREDAKKGKEVCATLCEKNKIKDHSYGYLATMRMCQEDSKAIQHLYNQKRLTDENMQNPFGFSSTQIYGLKEQRARFYSGLSSNM